MPPARQALVVAGALVVVVALVVAAVAVGPGFLDPEDAEGPADVTPPDGDGSDGDPNTPPTDDGDDPPEPYEGPHDVHLLVRAGVGPDGEGEPHAADRGLFSTNIWFQRGWLHENDPVWKAHLSAMRPGALRWPSGHPSQGYCWVEPDTGKEFPGCEDLHHRVDAHMLGGFVELCKEMGAEPVIGVNVKRGTPEMAAAMVRWANVEQGLGITWWYIGNEPDLGGDTSRSAEFNRQYAAFSAAMREVDPSIKLVAPEIMTGADVTGVHGRMDWIRPFLEEHGDDVDAISWHLYPLDSENRSPSSSAHPTPEHLLQWRAPDWQVSGISFIHIAQQKLQRDRAELAPDAEIWVTEVGPDSGMPGAPGITDGHVGAVWFADVLGRFAEEDADVVMQFAFDHWEKDVDELSLIWKPNGSPEPLPPYVAYWLHANAWGDSFHVVNASSSNEADVGVHAAWRDDGRLAVIMVNKNMTESKLARLTLEDVGPLASADTWVMEGTEGPTSLTGTTVNGELFTAQTLDPGTIPAGEGSTKRDDAWELPPLSVTVVVFEPEES